MSKPEDYLALAVQLALDNVGIRRVYYVYSNEDGEPVGLSTSSLYAELTKPLSMQAMRLEHRPVRPAGLDLYEAWKRLNHDPPKE